MKIPRVVSNCVRGNAQSAETGGWKTAGSNSQWATK